ncbi:MAG TPA: glycosyltransferase family 1 protein [Polyangiaceae bacterium]
MQRATDLVCFSHLRWNFVFQRPNHLMSRCARERRVFFFEEPCFEGAVSHSVVREVEPNLFVVTPWLPVGLDEEAVSSELRRLLSEVLVSRQVSEPLLWFYTPMALAFAGALPASLIVYDCMDELSAFHGAPARLRELERELFARADLVFTGGASLYQAKREQHADVHLFPSSVDVKHFSEAQRSLPEPPDQERLERPRVGFFGVIDERMDLDLIDRLARARPNWQIVMVGPIVKIEPARLPRRPNVHYLGQKSYAELPRYLAGWDVAIMPFALNEATRFISPTKTLEYLAGGKSVVSTPIQDVVSPYAEQQLVRVADADGFVSAVAAALAEGSDPGKRSRVEAVLAQSSWDSTWSRMSRLIESKLATPESRAS